MRTQVFAYKGILGIKSSVDADGIVNHPPTCKVFLVDANFIDISHEALSLLKKIQKNDNSISDVMSYNAGDRIIFGWTENTMKMLTKHTFGNKGYNPLLLKSIDGVKIDKGFMSHVNKMEEEGKLEEYKIS